MHATINAGEVRQRRVGQRTLAGLFGVGCVGRVDLMRCIEAGEQVLQMLGNHLAQGLRGVIDSLWIGCFARIDKGLGDFVLAGKTKAKRTEGWIAGVITSHCGQRIEVSCLRRRSGLDHR